MTLNIDQFLMNSTCASKKEEKEYLYKLLNKKQRLVTSLFYRGSLHGWKAIDFHSRCDKRGPTISLFKLKDGDCIGGYTKAQLSSENKYADDKEAFLFNLTWFLHFPSKLTGTEIYNSKKFGPCFSGNGATELTPYNEPFNGQGNCISWTNAAGYDIPDFAGLNILTQQSDGLFTQHCR